MQEELTEIEGAILSEIEHRGHSTAFQVRRAFQRSPSIEWSGSAGSVYPAVKRLQKRGLIFATPVGDAKSTMHLAVSNNGKEALFAWSLDPQRAASVGIDPFRLRAGIWKSMPAHQQRQIYNELGTAILMQIDQLEHELKTNDPIEVIRLELNLQLQKARLIWLNANAQALDN